MAKRKVLFVCIHNSARSQMAEAFLNQTCAEQFEAYSAGIEPGKLNPIVVEALAEIGIDISRNQTKSVEAMLKSGKTFSHVVTVCDETSAERCPFIPGLISRLHWGFPDPSALQGSHADKLARTREIRDTIKAKVEEWCAEVCPAVPAEHVSASLSSSASGGFSIPLDSGEATSRKPAPESRGRLFNSNTSHNIWKSSIRTAPAT